MPVPAPAPASVQQRLSHLCWEQRQMKTTATTGPLMLEQEQEQEQEQVSAQTAVRVQGQS